MALLRGGSRGFWKSFKQVSDPLGRFLKSLRGVSKGCLSSASHVASCTCNANCGACLHFVSGFCQVCGDSASSDILGPNGGRNLTGRSSVYPQDIYTYDPMEAT